MADATPKVWDLGAIERVQSRLPDDAAKDTPEQADIRTLLMGLSTVALVLSPLATALDEAKGLAQQIAPPAEEQP